MELLYILALIPLVWVALGFLVLSVNSALSEPKLQINLQNLVGVLRQMTKGLR